MPGHFVQIREVQNYCRSETTGDDQIIVIVAEMGEGPAGKAL